MAEEKRALISVIVPVYNVEPYLRRCLDSILRQTYDHIEVLLIDDGSTDSSPALCDAYARLDSRVKAFHMKNGGISSARNVGIDHANGAYVLFVDSDDDIELRMVENLYRAITENAADLCVCGYWNDYADGRTEPVNLNQGTRVYSNLEAYAMLFGTTSESLTFTLAWNKLCRRELFETIRYPAGKIHEDDAVAYQLLYRAKKVVYISEELYHYRHRDDSITGKPFSKKRFDGVEAMRNRMLFSIEHNLYTNKAVRRYLSNFRNFIDQYGERHPSEKDYLRSLRRELWREYKTYKRYLSAPEQLGLALRLAFPGLFQLYQRLIQRA